jgi:hypothetical protein
MMFTSSGKEMYRAKLQQTSIGESTRVATDELAVLGVRWVEKSKAWQLTIKLVQLTPTGLTSRDVGTVPRSGMLISPDPCTVCWLRGKEVMVFGLCE